MVLSRQPVPVGEWAAELARALVGYAEQNARAAEALRRLVTGTLGGDDSARCGCPLPRVRAAVYLRSVLSCSGLSTRGSS